MFYDYSRPSTVIPDQQTAELCFPFGDSDNDNLNGADGGHDEDLSGQLAGPRSGDAGAGTRTHHAHHYGEQNSSTTRTSLNRQWETDNLPIEGAGSRAHRARYHSGQHSSTARTSSNHQWETDNQPMEGTDGPLDEEATEERIPHRGGLSDELSALVALENAYKALEMPIMDDVDGEDQHCMIQLAVHFIFETLPWLNHIREDLEELGDLYNEITLAEQFYNEYRVALWGPGGGDGGEIDSQRLTRLETFFVALRTQDSTRSEALEFGDQSLRQVVHLRRTTAAASGVVPSGTDPDASLSELYSSLELQNRDIWIDATFPRAVAEMIVHALSHIRDPVDTFPCSRPSDALIDCTVERVMDRWARKLWPKSNARPNDVAVTLYQYILVLVKIEMTGTEFNGAVRLLDGFLKLEDGDAEEKSNHAQDEPRDPPSFECPLVLSAEFESCSQRFASAADVVAHLVAVHEWEQEIAEDVVYDG